MMGVTDEDHTSRHPLDHLPHPLGPAQPQPGHERSSSHAPNNDPGNDRFNHPRHRSLRGKDGPAAPGREGRGTAIGRMLLDKHFHGDLEATSKGTMLAAGTTVKGSAGYVAMELVTGTLKGHTGTFVLQHTGIMTRGVPQLTITVVPDSGTGQLVGLTGKMAINIVDGKHSYDFEYTLPEAP
jgi:Protein of unknown function (DUF3224)